MTAPTAPATVLTEEQEQALALLAAPDELHTGGVRYVLRQHQARQAHRQVTRLLTRIDRAELIQSVPVNELAALAANPARLRLHPADEQAISALAAAFPEDLAGVGMTFLFARLSHDSMQQHRARKAAAGR